MFDLPQFLLRVFYWPTCLFKLCDEDEEEFMGFFVPGHIEGIYKTRCKYCKREYVRNTRCLELRITYNDSWKEYWDRFHPIKRKDNHEETSEDRKNGSSGSGDRRV